MRRLLFLSVVLIAFIAAGCAPAAEMPIEEKAAAGGNAPEATGYQPFKPGPTYRDIAYKYMSEGNYEEAVGYLEKWLAADAGDDGSWYNLACAYAINGDAEKAVVAFERSVDLGWNDYEHAMKDPDLASVRDLERFLAAVERQKTAASQPPGGPKDFIRHFTGMKSLWTYIVALPEDYKDSQASYPLVVILHGHGSTELGHGRLADAFGRDGVIYLCVRAPYAWEEVMMGGRQKSYSAWPSDRIKGEDAGKLITGQYIEWIFTCVDDAKKHYRIEGEKVYLWGHSQGAFFANACAMVRPERVASYFAYAGGMMDEMKDPAYGAEMKKQGVKPWIVHCEDDNVVEFERSKELVGYLEAAGVEHLFIHPAEGRHGVTKRVAEHSKAWVETEVLGK